MIAFKDGVSIYGLHPETLWAIDRCHECSPSNDITVTGSRYNEKHSNASLHNAGHAFDLRTRNLVQEQIRDWILKIRSLLGPSYDVIFEGDHIHVEFQPKGIQEYPGAQP